MDIRWSATFVICLAIVVGAELGCSKAAADRLALSPNDERAIRALDSTYVAAWLRDDTTAVLGTLASNAVLMPAGHRPLPTPPEIRAFWWPTDGSHTKLLTFSRTIDELAGGPNIAYVRGTDSLAFTYEKGGATTNQRSRSMTLSVVQRQADGQWRITRMMWGTRAN